MKAGIPFKVCVEIADRVFTHNTLMYCTCRMVLSMDRPEKKNPPNDAVRV